MSGRLRKHCIILKLARALVEISFLLTCRAGILMD